MCENYKLHIATDESEKPEYLRKVAEYLLEHLVPPNEFRSSILKTFGREILANTVWLSALDVLVCVCCVCMDFLQTVLVLQTKQGKAASFMINSLL